MQTLVTARTILLKPDGTMLILRRSASDPLAPGSWDLPGGRQEADETAEAAANRETVEEVGVQMRQPYLLFATSAMRKGTSKTWLFFVEEVPTDVSVTLGDEHDDSRWIRPSELNRYTDYEILLRFHSYVAEHGLLGGRS